MKVSEFRQVVKDQTAKEVQSLVSFALHLIVERGLSKDDVIKIISDIDET